MTIYSENAVLLALSLCCFIHAVKYMMPSLIPMYGDEEFDCNGF